MPNFYMRASRSSIELILVAAYLLLVLFQAVNCFSPQGVYDRPLMSHQQAFYHFVSACGSRSQPIMLRSKAGSHSDDSSGTGAMPSSTSLRPLYDGTNYTFPDTTTPTGIAELLEVSFVKACMQLATGYVDVLKLFIAVSIAAYEFQFSLETLQGELKTCPRQTANRPLMAEEIQLRSEWLGIIYMTLTLLKHPTNATTIADTSDMLDSIPVHVRQQYEGPVVQIVEALSQGKSIQSVQTLLSDSSSLSETEKAVKLQSLRVASLIPVVLEECSLARTCDGPSIEPPKPPIKGAFE